MEIPASGRLKALADETRMNIVRHLGADERCVCELTEALGIGQSLLSFHLRILKEAGLVSDRREGRWAYYTVNAEAFRELAAALSAFASLPSNPRRKTRACADGRE